MYCFGFITRGEDRLYRADLHDFPGCVAFASGIRELPTAVSEAVVQHLRDRPMPLPQPTPPAALPRPAGGQAVEGFWMAFDLGPVLEEFVRSQAP